MLSASHWLLAQALFCGRMHLPLSPNSTTPTVQVIFRYLRPDAPVFNIHRIHSNCGHGDILAITLLILSLSGCSYVNILWYTAPVDMMTFRWSHWSYQSICQQHLPYSYLQVTLMYYTSLLYYENSPTVHMSRFVSSRYHHFIIKVAQPYICLGSNLDV